MDYTKAGLVTQDETFRLRVQVAVFVAAQRVMDEPPDTNNHDLRQRLAAELLAVPTRRLDQFVWLCATTPGIAETVTTTAGGVHRVGAPDADIQAAVDGGWNVVAGWATR